MSFIDYSKAFDCENIMMYGMDYLNSASIKRLSLIKNLYAGQEMAVSLDAELSDWLLKVSGKDASFRHTYSAYTLKT